VKRLASDWENQAQRAIDEQMPELAQGRDEVADRLDKIRTEIADLMDGVRINTDELDLPDIPGIPVPEIDDEGTQRFDRFAMALPPADTAIDQVEKLKRDRRIDDQKHP
jgi:hypothetical protein